jgi:hypothetical protein
MAMPFVSLALFTARRGDSRPETEASRIQRAMASGNYQHQAIPFRACAADQLQPRSLDL